MTQWPRYTLASGPVDVSPETQRQMMRPVVYHYDPAFLDIFEHTISLLGQVYQTKYDPVIMQAEAILGLEAAAASLFQAGDKVLNLVSGVFGKGYEDWITYYGAEPIELAVPYNDAIDPEDVRRILHTTPGIRYLSVVHSETPSGTVNPVREICRIAQEFGVLTIVDTVSGLGSELVNPEDWGIDIAVAGPQKCLGGPPGLSLMTVSPAAWQAMENRKHPLRNSFLSILDWKTTWIEERRFPYTPSVSEIYALESILEQTMAEGLEHVAGRHQAAAFACRRGVEALGLDLWAAEEGIAAACCTAVATPEGIDDKQLRSVMRNRYGVMISPGFGELSGKLVRLGHMASAAHPTVVALQLAMFERSLTDLGYPVKLGSGVGAAMDALSGWDDLSGALPVHD
ncbi:MAG: alanine--glyoxylate aminotransferase family protein [Thermomicrobiales bacterium]